MVNLNQTLPLAPAAAKPKAATSSDVSTKPLKAAPSGLVSSKSPGKSPAKPPAPIEKENEGGSFMVTAVLSLAAAAASYFGITAIWPNHVASTAQTAPTVAAPVPAPVAPAAAPQPKITTSESPLPPGTDVPAGSGLLEIEVPDGTSIRVDGDYLGMGPRRRVPLTPGPHKVLLGDGEAMTVTVKAGQRTLAVLAASPGSAPARSP